MKVWTAFQRGIPQKGSAKGILWIFATEATILPSARALGSLVQDEGLLLTRAHAVLCIQDNPSVEVA